jgi:hypothetical protein
MAKSKAGATAPLSMADRDGWIWYDGKLVPWRSATTHVLTHSLHYGLAVFEGVRAYKTVSGTQIFRLRDHTQRLINSGHIYLMKVPYTIERLMQAALADVIAAAFYQHRREFFRHHCLQKGNILLDQLLLQGDRMGGHHGGNILLFQMFDERNEIGETFAHAGAGFDQ